MSARLIKNVEASAALFVPFGMRASDNFASAAFEASSERENGFRPPSFPTNGGVTGEVSDESALDQTASASVSVVANEQAEAIIAEARREAAQLIGAAEERVAELERAAEERALLAAREQLAGEVAQAVEPLRARLTQSLDELQVLRSQIAQRAERDIVRLSIEIARKVVHREVSVDPDIVLTLASVALSRLHNRSSNSVARIHLHPDDLAYVQTHQARLETSGGSLELVADRTVEAGGCLVHTEMGDIDARIERQFAEIERGFLKA